MFPMHCRCARLQPPPRNLPKQGSQHRSPSVPPVLPETILVAIALKILFADRVIHPANTPLQLTPETLNRVRVDMAHDVYLGRMIDAVMLVLLRHLPELVIDRITVRVYRRSAQHALVATT